MVQPFAERGLRLLDDGPEADAAALEPVLHLAAEVALEFNGDDDLLIMLGAEHSQAVRALLAALARAPPEQRGALLLNRLWNLGLRDWVAAQLMALTKPPAPAPLKGMSADSRSARAGPTSPTSPTIYLLLHNRTQQIFNSSV